MKAILTSFILVPVLAAAEVQEFNQPQAVTQSSVTYRFNEIRTQPGDDLKFAIPKHLQDQKLSFVILGHRQDPATHKGGVAGQKHDQVPGLSAVLVHATNLMDPASPDAWRYWTGLASGNMGAKFAEPRSEPEMENLYEWTTTGSRGAQSNDYSLTPLLIDGVMVKNIGQDEVLVSQLTLKFLPSGIDHHQEVIFSPGTSFGKEFGDKAKLGGGQAYQGLFPQALVLSGSIHEIVLEDGWTLKGIEVAMGDSKPDQKTNIDGGWGTPGWAKFSIGIGPNRDQIQWLTENENVPPEGLALAYPKELTVTKDTKLYLRSQYDTMYVMGVRISFRK